MSTEPDSGAHYRGTRRRLPDGLRWRRYPAGATFIVALLVLVTSAVVLRTLLGAQEPPNKRQADGLRPPPALIDPSPAVPAATASGSPTFGAPVASGRTDRERSPVPNRSTGTTTAPAPTASLTAPSLAPVGARIVGIGGKCVEVAADGVRVQLGTCNLTFNQRWIRGDGVVRALGKCLDVQHGRRDNRTPVQVYQCNGTGAQQWEFRADGTWRNPQSGRCLDAENGLSADGTRLIIFDCTGGTSQRWSM